MKIMVITITGILLTFAYFQAKTAQSTGETEQRKYEVLRSEGKFEIRYYPPVISAAFKADKLTANNGFRVLAGYIFGGNEESTAIAMTSPVEMESTSSGQEMRFTMPSDWSMASLPTPNDDRIRIEETEGFYAATIRYDGFTDSSKEKKYGKELLQWLKKEKIDPLGDIVRLGYNPPYQLIQRRNELLYRINLPDTMK